MNGKLLILILTSCCFSKWTTAQIGLHNSSKLKPLSKNVLHDTNTRRSYFAIYVEEKHTHPVDIKSRIYIDSLQQIGVDTILFYRDWIGMNGYNGYGKLLWTLNGLTHQYQITYDNHYRMNEDVFIKHSEDIKSEAFSFYIKNKIDNITSKPKQSVIQMSHDADHFIFSYINKKEYSFHVSGLEHVYDSSHIKSQLINKLQIPWSLYFNTIEQRRDTILSDYDLTVDWLKLNITDSSGSFPVTLHNYSEDTLYYYSMSCSWQDFYLTSDSTLQIDFNLCGKNVPKILSIAPNKSSTDLLHISGKDILYKPFKIGIQLYKAQKSDQPRAVLYDERMIKPEVIWTRIID